MEYPGIITLTTDFGDRDGFIGIMKGVILSINPNAKIVEITNKIERYNISQAAFVIKNSFSFFPKKTIHIVIADPGVGSSRRIIILKHKEHLFIAPDNGIIKYIIPEKGEHQVYNVINKDYFLEDVSSTFHGRDIFAPVSAHLSLGINPKKLGPQIFDYIKNENLEPIISKNKIIGKAIYFDRFGNIITNIKKDDIPGNVRKDDVLIKIKEWNIKGITQCYSDGNKAKPSAIFGSSGFLEIAIYLGNAAEILGVKIDEPVNILFK